MVYKEEKRDLFSVPSDYYLVQCISADFAMGKGIAVEFNKRFDAKNRMLNTYDKNCWYGGGWCAPLTPDVPVINLVTKSKYWEKPTYETMREALVALYTIFMMSGKTGVKIAMPKIGCGLDGLEWDRVSKIIQDTFADMDIEILVCYL